MTFLDTNVLVYAVDQKDPSKQAKAREVILVQLVVMTLSYRHKS